MDLGLIVGIGDAVAIGVLAYVLKQRFEQDKRYTGKSLASIEGALTKHRMEHEEAINALRLIPAPPGVAKVDTPAKRPGRHEFFQAGADFFECKLCGCGVTCHPAHHEIIHNFRFDACPNDKRWTVDRNGEATCE